MTTTRWFCALPALCLLPLLVACNSWPPGLPAAPPPAAQATQPVPLAGTAWQVQSFSNGGPALVGLLGGTAITLAFGADGQLSGSAGCNRYGGRYTQAGEPLVLGPLVSTRKGCAVPEGLMAQESAFLRALETVATARRDGARLELRNAAGAVVVNLVLAP